MQEKTAALAAQILHTLFTRCLALSSWRATEEHWCRPDLPDRM